MSVPAANLKTFVGSEVDPLRRVIIHRPDKGIEMVTPDKAQEYLYDDIVFLKKMKAEHDVFVSVLKWFIGDENVLDIEYLLAEILSVEHVNDDLIDAICQFENTHEYTAILKSLSPLQLANACITGLIPGFEKLIFPPVSNLIFCRDVGVVINDWILVGEAAKTARSRESIIGRFLFKYCSLFDKNKKIEISSLNNFFESPYRKSNLGSIEGGDVMLLDPEHLLVGLSERTTEKAIQHLVQTLLSEGVVKSVTQVSLPKQRYCMHLDTIITFISHNDCVAFSPLVSAPAMQVVEYYGKELQSRHHATLEDMLKTIRPDLKIIPCGGGVWPHAEREQWTDGCNLFALRSGVAMTYDRNTHTSKILKKHGYSLVSATSLLKKLSSGQVKPSEISDCIILIPSDELSRARGGTHCLTLPILRRA